MHAAGLSDPALLGITLAQSFEDLKGYWQFVCSQEYLKLKWAGKKGLKSWIIKGNWALV